MIILTLAVAFAWLARHEAFSPKHVGPVRYRSRVERWVECKSELSVTKEETLTVEATELLEAIDSQSRGNDDAPSLIIAQVAPSVRVAISEEFGLGPGEYTSGTLVAALKELGFDKVLDTNVAADLTICEEGTELLHRIEARRQGGDETESKPLPLFTSCCPGWMAFIEKSEPELAKYVSTCKSPHMMYGALVKQYSEELLGTPAEKVYFTSVMPCVRKRGESDRAAFSHDGIRDVDNVITTKDLGQLLRLKGIDPSKLDPCGFDSPFQTDGAGTGAGQLFGATGGVMEAAVRSVYELITGSKMQRLELDEVRGLDGVKEANIQIYNEEADSGGPPLVLRCAVASGLGNAKKLIKKMKNGEVQYDFVEVMACPGGCIGGGGQPKGEKGAVEKRLDCIYQIDRTLPIRRSHENPVVQAFYDKYLGEYGGDKAHDLLHVKPVYGETPETAESSKEID